MLLKRNVGHFDGRDFENGVQTMSEPSKTTNDMIVPGVVNAMYCVQYERANDNDGNATVSKYADGPGARLENDEHVYKNAKPAS